MKNFKTGAWRRATNGAHASHIAAATDLVNRTLAQHGLSANMPAGLMPATQKTQQFHAKHSELSHSAGGGSLETFQCKEGSRKYKIYVPETAGKPALGLIVMLHGCTQNADDFAAGTGMNALADRHGFIVIYPEQARGDNAQSCWNWFRRGDQMRGRGEPAIIASLTRQIAEEHGVTRDATFVAGLSAGAAMAVILGETYSDVFAGVGAHSGLAYGSAHDVPSAFNVMSGGNAQKPSFPAGSTPPRSILFQGAGDSTVHPSNLTRIAQDLRDRFTDLTVETSQHHTASRHAATSTRISAANGTPLLECWRVDGLGHAWSGGQTQGSYTDPDGPDASAEMVRFFFETADGAS